jgi:two-component system, sensor histidine kinase and response regulator
LIRLEAVRILVADDIATNQLIVQEMLRHAGAEVECVANGAEALAAVNRACFDLILMDVQMPVMDGLEATRRLRQNGFTAPILAMTANVMSQDREACRAAGMDGFVSKPVDEQQLLATVAAQVASRNNGALPRPVPQAQLPASLPGLDLTEGLRRMGGREAMLLTMLHSLAQDERANVEQVRAHADRGEAAAAGRIGHALKGLAANLGCPRLTAAAAAVELAGRDPQPSALEAAVRELEAAFAEVADSVGQLPAAG